MSASHIVAKRCGSVGVIVLDRPRALNAMDLGMFTDLRARLGAWRDDDTVAAVVVRGAGGSFCAGGDIRAVRAAETAGDHAHNERMYAEEYRLNALIHAYPKPYVAAIDGYCMGGGLGLAAHGTFRAASQRATFAMPETTIGFFPDVGMSYVLPRIPYAIGWYIGLLGTRLTAADALYCGLVTHILADTDLASIEERIAAAPDRASIAALLDTLAVAPGISVLERERETIARCFSAASLLDIVAALESELGPWAQATLTRLHEASPTSAALTFELLQRGRSLDIDACLEQDYQLAVRVCQTGEFAEGVRAAVIDKDRTPVWQPPQIEDVSESDVHALWRGVDIARNELALR